MVASSFSDIELGTRFDTGTRKRAMPIDPRKAYGTVSYSIGERSEREYLKRAIAAFTDTLPAKFGNSAGTYTITLDVKDSSGRDLAKEPILSFQWQNQRVFFFIDKVVERLQATDWSGTLVDQALVTDATRRLQIGVTVALSSQRSMDFESLKTTAKMFSEGALVSLLPLPASTLGIVTAVGELVNLFYSGSKKETLVEAEEFALTAEEQQYPAPIRFRDDQGRPWTLPIKLSLRTNQSRYMSGDFDSRNISVTIADERVYTIVTTKDKVVKASLLELLRSSEEYQDIRTLLDRVASGKSYEEPDLAVRCAALYGAFVNYLSIYDARALFWAFLKKNAGLIDPGVALGGGRREEIEAVGFRF